VCDCRDCVTVLGPLILSLRLHEVCVCVCMCVCACLKRECTYEVWVVITTSQTLWPMGKAPLLRPRANPPRLLFALCTCACTALALSRIHAAVRVYRSVCWVVQAVETRG
jgi:hypothetical protein